MLKGFRDFIMRGNVIDLAVAVVIGAAFTALVNAFAKALIDPIINHFMGGGIHGTGFQLFGITFDWALLLNATITFIITAGVVYFVFVMPMKKITDRFYEDEEEEVDPAHEQVLLLREIRDSLAKQEELANGSRDDDSV